MWENIRCHSFLVARVAELLQQRLAAADRVPTVPSRELVIAGALLHDIAKSKCLEENCRHAEVGAQLCAEAGYREISPIVANHVLLADYQPDRYGRGEFSASELVFYADKRVKHDQVVGLDERLEYILAKYAGTDTFREKLIRENFAACRVLEQHLFARLDIEPDDVAILLARQERGPLHYPAAPSTNQSSR